MATYLDLRSDIASELARGDLTAVIPRFVRQATQRINRDVRVSDMERRARAFGAGSRYLASPSGFLEMRRMWNVLSTGQEPQIRQVSPQQLRHNRAGGALPTFFCLTRGDPPEIEFDAPAAEDREIEMVYMQAYPEFTEDTDTNWILTNHYDLYFESSLFHAHRYLRNVQESADRAAAYRQALSELMRSEMRQAYMQPMRAMPTQAVF